MSDRTWLPEGQSQMRARVEKEIVRWGLDRGLARVDTLTTQVAKDYQQILNTIPNIEGGSETYQKHQFVTISWLAAQSGRILHLVEGEHVIMRQTKSGPKELDVQQYIQNSSNTKDTIYLAFKDLSTYTQETLYI